MKASFKLQERIEKLNKEAAALYQNCHPYEFHNELWMLADELVQDVEQALGEEVDVDFNQYHEVSDIRTLGGRVIFSK